MSQLGSMQRSFGFVLALACALVLSQGIASAQVSTASINGTVRDTTGAVIPEAELTLENVETGISRRAVSNSVGNYALLNLTPGIYTLQVGKEGFRTGAISPFTLDVNQAATFDLTLEVGAVTETVTVEAIGAQVQSSTSELGTVVGQQQVADLPLNGRNFTQLMVLTPGASPVSTAQNRGGFGASATGSFIYPSINGQSNRSNFFLMDGVNNNGATVGTYAVPPIIDAIQEFKVQSHNDLAEFGQGSGGIVNVVTRSGTNDMHGAGWWFLRNDNLDARNFFRPSVTPLAQNMYGGTVGGKVIRNKTFYFLSYQGYKRRTPANRLYRVPTAANLQGDLSDWPLDIYDPFTTRDDGTGAFIRDVFPNNIMPQGRLDAGLVAFAQATLQAPIATGVADQNALDSTNTATNQEEYSARADHSFSENDTMWVRVSGLINPQDGSGGRQSLGSTNDWTSSNIGSSWVHTFNPTSIMQLSFARTWTTREGGRTFEGSLDPATFGFSQQFCCSFRSGAALMPEMRVNQFFRGGEALFKNFTTQNYAFKGDYSKIFGNHQLKVGAEHNDLGNSGGGVTNDILSGFITSQTAGPAGTGSPLASYLLNAPNNASRRDFFKTLHRTAISGFFIQDTWKATSKLTVNIGLRYDHTKTPLVGSFEDGVIFTGTPDFESTQGGLHILQAAPGPCAQLGAAPCIPTPDGSLPDGVVVSSTGRLLGDWTDNWQPRFGLAYRLSDKTALRSSFGMFFDSLAGLTQMTQAFGHTWPDVGQRQTGDLNTPTPAQPTPSVLGTVPFPGGAIPEPTPFGRTAWYGDPRIKNQYSMQWNLGLQHQVTPDTLLSANYVGSGNRRAPLDHFYNTSVTPGPGNPADRRLFPFISPTFWQQSDGRANYHAFQFQLRKRASDFTYVINYTWSKAINIACDGWYGVEGCSTQNPYNHNADRSVAGQSLTHMFNVNWVYRLPFGVGSRKETGNRALDHIIGNWQINGIATFNSGQPHGVILNGDVANTGNRNGYMRPNIVGNAELSNPTVQRWFNTDAFAAPAQFTYGNSGRHNLRADGITNFDLSVFRDFPLPGREGMKMQFRAEAFNAFNHADFNIPVSNLSNINFGRVLSTSPAHTERQFQLSLKFIF